MSLNENAKRTAATVAVHHFVGGKRARRGKLPKQARPVLIEREYGAALSGLVSAAKMREAFRELLEALPELLASARAERGDVVDAITATAMAIAGIPGPAARVHAWLAARKRHDADEGKRVRGLVEKAKEKLRGSVSTRAIEDLAEKFAQQTSTFQRIQLSRQTKSALGVDIFTNDKGMQSRIANFASENVALIKGAVENDMASKIEKMVTRALTGAQLHGDLAKDLEKEFGYPEKRAKLIARDQIGKFYGQVNASRQKDLGVTQFVWRTVGDERVRDNPDDDYYNHEDRDGETYSYDDPPYGELPGEAVLCRCYAEPSFEGILDGISGDNTGDEGGDE